MSLYAKSFDARLHEDDPLDLAPHILGEHPIVDFKEQHGVGAGRVAVNDRRRQAAAATPVTSTFRSVWR